MHGPEKLLVAICYALAVYPLLLTEEYL